VNKLIEIFRSGLLYKNPLLVLVLGLSPALVVTTTLETAVGMGIVLTAVLMVSGAVVSLLRHAIPKGIRFPCYVAVTAGMVTAADMLLQARFPEHTGHIGLYIPMVVASCVVLARAETFASENRFFTALADGLAMGLGFTAALTAVSVVRELLGSGSVFGYTLLPGFQPAYIMLLPPGGLLAFGFVAAALQKMRKAR